MRIIGGKYGGRVIRVPQGLPVRPTTDRTKEALFNILGQRMTWEGARVLDLFAGTGNITLECYSRGAAGVVSVDRHPRCVEAIRGALQALDLPVSGLVRADVLRYVQTATGTYDLIFMDPPYDLPGQPALIATLLQRGLLAPGGWLVAEHSPVLRFETLPGWVFGRQYGSSALSFFSMPDAAT
ncbi:MAG: 16S rRNA (guanine(966)-N(2))-methyltransferase RsmD [Bacteroidia bacterium]